MVFWQTDEHDQPAVVTESYDKAFTAANIKKEQQFYDSELCFNLSLTDPVGGRSAQVSFTLQPEESFPKVFEKSVARAFKDELVGMTNGLEKSVKNRASKRFFIDSLAIKAEWTHRHYVKDDEYIPFGEEIEAFLHREIGKPIIRSADSPQLGYEILPNKYFYRYQPPTPAKELLAEFWRLEREAENLLKGLAE